ncbi:MAG: DsbA family protein [Pseudomonadota bacterium]
MLRKINMLLVFFVGLAMAMFAVAAPTSSVDNSFNAQQTKEIQKIVHEYLLKNPQIMVEVATKLRAMQEEKIMKQAKKAIQTDSAAIFAATNSPVIGNKQGSVTLVEFFDYQCPHCKAVYPLINKLIKENPNLRVILKEFPIFPGSEYAARAALAAKDQGKYAAMHEALFAIEDPITEAKVDAAAEKIGLNLAELKKDMQSKAVSDELKANVALAQKIGIIGTPSFVIANFNQQTQKLKNDNYAFVPGVVSLGALQQLITKAKANG